MYKILKKTRFLPVIEFINQNGGSSTWTKLSRGLELDNLEDIWNWAQSNRYIEVGSYNKFKLTGSFSIKESDYYCFLKYHLNNVFAEKLTKGDIFDIEITAKKDSQIAGRWTRPDLVGFQVRRFPYIIDSELDLITFEVKRKEDVNVIAVFEALAHRSAASKSYVVFPSIEKTAMRDRIYEEAGRHGIGIIVIGDVFSNAPLSIEIEAIRVPLDKEKSSDFLQAVMTPGQLATLSRAR